MNSTALKLANMLDNGQALVKDEKGGYKVVNVTRDNEGKLRVAITGSTGSNMVGTRVLIQDTNAIIATAEESALIKKNVELKLATTLIYRSSGYRLTESDIATIKEDCEKYGYSKEDNLLEVGKVARLEYQKQKQIARCL